MVNDAEAYKDEDDKQKDRIAAKNGLESFNFNMKSSLDGAEVKSKLSEEEVKSVQSKLENALRWLDSNQLADKEEFVDKQKEIEEVTRPIIAKSTSRDRQEDKHPVSLVDNSIGQALSREGQLLRK